MDTNLHQKRIVWMIDETIANTRPQEWRRVLELETELVNIIGHPEFRHEVVNPLPCLTNIVNQLKDKKFYTVIDLAGWLTPAMHELYPNIPVVNSFSLSRVRVVSSPRLETSGYTVSMTKQEIESVATHLNLSNTLIVDDVSFSGWTSRKTMEMWGLDPKTTTHAFLIANTGQLGEHVDGAVPMLEKLGSNVIYGHELTTPHEDGWHLKDLHQHPNIKDALEISISLQKDFESFGVESENVSSKLQNEKIASVLFPERVGSEAIRMMQLNGRFIAKNGQVVEGNEVHAKNPFLWASQYFLEHIDPHLVESNQSNIIRILSELKILTDDPLGRVEAKIELQNEVGRSLNNFNRGKERL